MELIFNLKKGKSKNNNVYYYLYNDDLNKRIFLSDLELKVLTLINKETSSIEEDED